MQHLFDLKKRMMKESIEKYIKKAEEWTEVILNQKEELLEKDQNHLDSFLKGEYANWRNRTISKFDKTSVKRNIDRELGISVPRKQRRWRWVQSVAAVFVLVLLSGTAYWIYNDIGKIEVQIEPGRSVAYLEVNNKQKIELFAQDSLLLFTDSRAKIDSGKITYSEKENALADNEYHRINVPRNGEFYVQLSDGTKVWVNSESSIGFKTKFTGKNRVLDLTGEAYLEVARNVNKPFIVRTEKAHIKVLGTHFNVKAYPDDEYTYATLCEGKIAVSKGEMNQILQPNEQLKLRNKTGEYQLKKVDASIYSSWSKGKLQFKDEPLENIMTALSRWYDVSIFYTNESLKSLRFSISVNRYENIDMLLKQLELTNKVRFNLNQKAVVVNAYETK